MVKDLGTLVKKGASDLRTESLQVSIPLARCAEEMGYRRRLPALVMDCQRDRNIETVFLQFCM